MTIRETGEPGPVTAQEQAYERLFMSGLAWFDERTDRWVIAVKDAAAIEAEASRSVLGAVREGVEGLRTYGLNKSPLYLDRAAVLALLDTLTETCRNCHHADHGGEDFPCPQCGCRGRTRP